MGRVAGTQAESCAARVVSPCAMIAASWAHGLPVPVSRLAAEKAGEDPGGDFVGAGGNHASPFASTTTPTAMSGSSAV